MRKILLFLIPVLLFINMSYAFSCISSLDDFASQAILNKPGIDYNLGILDNADNVAKMGNNYIIQSEYNPNLAAILSSETFCNAGTCGNYLSVKLQAPVKIQQRTISHTLFDSSLSSVNLNITSDNYTIQEWSISCDNNVNPQQCELKNQNIDILVSPATKNGTYDLLVDILDPLAVPCSECDGKCLTTITGSFCISKNNQQDIETVLSKTGLVKSIGEIFVDYKVYQNGQSTFNDLGPELDLQIDWPKAMQTELEWLRKENIVHLTSADISEISAMSAKGKSGQNSAIVYSGNQWKYYYDTAFPDLTKLKNCDVFLAANIPLNSVSFPPLGINVYYLVPLVLAVSLAIIIAILFTIGRLFSRHQPKAI